MTNASMPHPKVTVLMSVHNGEEYLREAIKSILSQTFEDFEFIIINDASTDGSRHIVEEFSDHRIRLVDNEANLGLTASLNRGLDLAVGKYIARMDSDDISLPSRLEKQVAYMDAHPQTGACGTWVKTIGDTQSEVWDYPTDPAAIRSRLLFESVLAHPSVMINKELFRVHNLRYDPAWQRAQDYELWARCAGMFPLANLPEVLVMYRLHRQQIGRAKGPEQQEFANRVRRRELTALGVEYTAREFELHCLLSTWQLAADREFVEAAARWLEKLRQANTRSGYYPAPAFSRVLGERWFAVCAAARLQGLWSWRTFRQSPLSQWAGLSAKRKAGFWLKALIKKD